MRGLNLGCGGHILVAPDVDWINLDMSAREGVNTVADLEWPLPFADNQFDIVLAFHVFEHIQNYIELVKEVHRVLKPDGRLAVRLPEFPCGAAVADPTHVRFFVPMSIFHLTDHALGYDTGGLKGLFKLLWIESIPHSRPVLDTGMPGAYFTEIHADLLAVKP